jgi:hypothetical protein
MQRTVIRTSHALHSSMRSITKLQLPLGRLPSFYVMAHTVNSTRFPVFDLCLPSAV